MSRGFTTPLIGGRFFVYLPDEKEKWEKDTGIVFEDWMKACVAMDGHPRVLFGSYDVGTVMHESLHISYSLLARVGIQVDEDNHELLCYLQEWVFEQIQKVLNKYDE